MAECIGLAASLVALVQLAGAVTALGYGYIAGVKRAPDDLQQLVDELTALGKVLGAVRAFADANPSSTTLELLNDPKGPLSGCAEELEKLRKKLLPKCGFKGVIDNIKWPFKEQETLQHVARLERHKNLFVFALTADQMSLSRVIEAYVRNIDLAVEEIARCTRYTALAVEDLRDEIHMEFVTQNIRSQQEDIRYSAAKRKEVLNWLFSGPFEERHLEISRRRQEGTGGWLFQEKRFKEWINGGTGFPLLWGHGIPGAGKTFLSSVVIDHLLAQAVHQNFGVAYIYFHYQEQERQKPDIIISSLIKQLATQIPHLVGEIETLYDRLVGKNLTPTSQEKYTALVATFKWFSRVFFVFDALDECHQENQRDELLPLFQRLCEDGASVFLTSRPHPEDIQVHLSEAAKIELSAQNEDIERYVEAKINKNPRARRLVQQSKCSERIISEVKDCAKGMFLIVHFHIEYLCQQTTAKKMLKELDALKTLTSEERPLDPTYGRAMESIRRQSKGCRELAIRVLSWLLKARRLSVEELRTAVSVEPDTYEIDELDELDLPDAVTLLDVCAGLVTIDTSSNEIRLSHFTVQEYLTRSFKFPPDADLQVSMACIIYLSCDFMAKGPCRTREELEVRLRSRVLLRYAVFNVGYHLTLSDENLSTDTVLKFSKSIATSCSYMQVFYYYSFLDWRIVSEYQTPLHVAATIGHAAAVRQLLAEGIDLSVVDEIGDATPLSLASLGGHTEVVKLLLDHGADMTVRRSWGEAPLTLSSRQGHESVVRLLMDYGADISDKDIDGGAPLLWAVTCGVESIVKLLLDYGADHSFVDSGNGNSALMFATICGHESILKLLLERGADPSIRNREGVTPLQSAVDREQDAILRILLDHGVDVSLADNAGNTALHQAATSGRTLAAKLLLERGADPSVGNSYGETPVFIAASQGHESVLKLLLASGGDPSAQTNGGISPLQRAVSRKQDEILTILLDHGVDLSLVDKDGDTALHQAALDGYIPAVKLLLEKGADLKIHNHAGDTPLSSAVTYGHDEVVWLLKQHCLGS